jgi:hypothetical protein
VATAFGRPQESAERTVATRSARSVIRIPFMTSSILAKIHPSGGIVERMK